MTVSVDGHCQLKTERHCDDSQTGVSQHHPLGNAICGRNRAQVFR